MILASDGDDKLVGNEGSDFLYGGNGDDILEGGQGEGLDNLSSNPVRQTSNSTADGATDELFDGDGNDRFYTAIDGDLNPATGQISGNPDIIHDSDGRGALFVQEETFDDEDNVVYVFREFSNLTYKSSDQLNAEYGGVNIFPSGIQVAEHRDGGFVFAFPMPD